MGLVIERPGPGLVWLVVSMAPFTPDAQLACLVGGNDITKFDLAQ